MMTSDPLYWWIGYALLALLLLGAIYVLARWGRTSKARNFEYPWPICTDCWDPDEYLTEWTDGSATCVFCTRKRVALARREPRQHARSHCAGCARRIVPNEECSGKRGSRHLLCKSCSTTLSREAADEILSRP